MKQRLDESTILEHNRKVLSEGLDDEIWCGENESPEERLFKDVMSFDDGDGIGGETVLDHANAILESPALARRALRYLASKGIDQDDDAASVPRKLWDKVQSIAIDREIADAQPRPVRAAPAMESFIMGSNLVGESGYGRAILREMFGDDMDFGGGETVMDRAHRMMPESDYLADLAVRRLERMGYDRYDDAESVPSKVWNQVFSYAVDNAMEDDQPTLSDKDDGIDEVPAMESADFVASQEKVNDAGGMEKPSVKRQDTNLVAKRNRRLRSRTRNIQIWDSNKKSFSPEYANTRFNRMKDANDAIAKISGGSK
jgi:hypothetical protein